MRRYGRLPRMLPSAFAVVWILGVGAVCLPVRAQEGWSVANLHPGGATESYALGVSGPQQAGYARVGGAFHASLWSGTSDSWIDLHPEGKNESIASGITGSQQAGDAGGHAGVWSGTADSWLDLHPEGVDGSTVMGVSGTQQVGRATLGFLFHACLWNGTADSWVDLHPAGASESWALGTSGTQQVGFAVTNFGSNAGLWTGSPGSWVSLKPAGAHESRAYGTSGTHQAGWAKFNNNSAHAGIWSGTADSWVDLHPAGATWSEARGVFGAYQVGFAIVDGVQHAYLWSGTAESWVDLSLLLPGAWSFTSAQSVWSDGATVHVAGWGMNVETGRAEALLWTRKAVCYADFTGDGVLDLFDFLGYVNTFNAGDAAADCDGNGPLDLFDFLCFVNSFNQGCQSRKQKMARSTARLGAEVVGVCAAFAAGAAAQPGLEWGVQFGTSADETEVRIAPDGAEGVYVAGNTRGNLGGPNAGEWDGYLARYDGLGNRMWIVQFGTAGDDWAYGPAPDGVGGVFVGGNSGGELGGPSAGSVDAWLARYDGEGHRVWIEQLGTGTDDFATAFASDGAGGVFVAGHTWGSLGGQNAGNRDIWLARYNPEGERNWLLQFGTGAIDLAAGLAPDGAGGVIVGGSTYGSLGGPSAGKEDIWLARYDGGGGRAWITQFGSSSWDEAFAMSTDGSGGVLVTGITWGDLGGPNAGDRDVFVARHDGAGAQAWLSQFGTASYEYGHAVAPDGRGGAVVGGYSNGKIDGKGPEGPYVAGHGASGAQAWINQFGHEALGTVHGLAPDGAGGCFLSATTYGPLYGQHFGEGDAGLARLAGACYADFTGDGVLDLFDFLGYVNTFNGGDEAADCDGNGPLDLFDFLCFVNKFNEGC